MLNVKDASMVKPGNTKGGSITVPLTSCLFDWSGISCMTTDIFCKTDQSKSVKQELNRTVLLPPLVFPVQTL
jgi:hypothetical protein